MTTLLLAKTHKLISQSQYQHELSDFSMWLSTKHYKSFPIHRHIFRLNQVLLRMRQVEGSRVYDAADLDTMFDFGNGPESRNNECNAVHRTYTRFLQANGRWRKPPTDERFGALCAEYHSYLTEVRGLSRSTWTDHEHTVKDFLKRCARSPSRLKTLSLEGVEQFTLLRSREISRDSLQHVIGHLRAFLRYCHDRDHLIFRLDDTIETPRTHRGELPPRAMPWNDVQTLLSSIDRRSKAGWRDYCILHLIAHYGLRPVEVASLQLNSINWETRVLHVTQHKTQSSLLLPLAPPTIQILQDYLSKDRLRQGLTHPNLFLRVRCPDGPLLAYGIGDVFDKRMRIAKFRGTNYSVYCLRHSFAMRLLSKGVGIKAIGDVLGHRSIETTCSYLRLDVDKQR